MSNSSGQRGSNAARLITPATEAKRKEPRFRKYITPVIAKDVKVTEIFLRYVKEHHEDTDGSVADAMSVFRTWIEPEFADIRLRELSMKDMLGWVRLMMTEPSKRTGRPLAANSVLRNLSMVRCAFEIARRDGIIEYNPADIPRDMLPAAKTRANYNPKAWIFTPEEMRELILSPRIEMWRRVVYALLAFTGARKAEVFGAFMTYLHWEQEPLPLLSYETQWNRKKQRHTETKTKAIKNVPVHPTLQVILRKWLDLWPSVYGRAPTQTDLIVPYLVVRGASKGRLRPIHDVHFGTFMDQDLFLLGLKRRTAHMFRHTFITSLIQGGAIDRSVREMTHPRSENQNGDAFLKYTYAFHADCCEAISHLPLKITRKEIDSAFR